MWDKHVVSQVELSSTLHLTEIGPESERCGFWLYDTTRKMNLAMRAATREAALLEALAYYQAILHLTQTDNERLEQRLDDIRRIVYTTTEDEE